MVSPIFVSNFLKVLSFRLFLLADVYNYCEERENKAFIFCNYLATFWHSCQDSCLVKHFASTIGVGLAKKIFNSYIFDMFSVKKKFLLQYSFDQCDLPVKPPKRRSKLLPF